MRRESAITPLRRAASQVDITASGTPERHKVIGAFTQLTILAGDAIRETEISSLFG
jgi:hypothetical protein